MFLVLSRFLVMSCQGLEMIQIFCMFLVAEIILLSVQSICFHHEVPLICCDPKRINLLLNIILDFYQVVFSQIPFHGHNIFSNEYCNIIMLHTDSRLLKTRICGYNDNSFYQKSEIIIITSLSCKKLVQSSRRNDRGFTVDP